METSDGRADSRTPGEDAHLRRCYGGNILNRRRHGWHEQGAKVIITARRDALEEAAADHPEVKGVRSRPIGKTRELASHVHRWEERR
jgi:hypothetical protein